MLGACSLNFMKWEYHLGKRKCRDTSSGLAFRHSRSLSGFCPVFKLPDQHQRADKCGVLLFKEMKKLKLKSQISGECGDQSRSIKRATTGLGIHHRGDDRILNNRLPPQIALYKHFGAASELWKLS